MKNIPKFLFLLISISILFYLDFVRDYFFKNIGFQIYYLVHLSDQGVASIDNYTDSTIEYFIRDYSINELTNLKWYGTLFFSLTFGTLGAFINYFIYKKKEVLIYFSSIYTLLFISSLLFYALTYLNISYSFQQKSYLISMEIAHFLQSSLPTLLFLVSFKLYKENEH